MQIHELNSFSGTPGETDYLAIDNGSETMKVPANEVGTDTTYAAMTQAQAVAGTDTTPKVIAPNVFKASVLALNACVEFTCTRSSDMSGGEARGIYDPASGIVSINFYCTSNADIATTAAMFTVPSEYIPSADKGGTGMLKNSANNVAATGIRLRAASGAIVQLGSGTARNVQGVIQYKL